MITALPPVSGHGSLAEAWAALPKAERDAIMAELSLEDQAVLAYDWSFWGGPKQQAPPGDWRTWLILAGRGYGKTRTGAEHIRAQVEKHGKRAIALVGPTAADVRDVLVEGPSGILNVCPPWNRPKYQPSNRRIVWDNGAVAHLYSADEPDRLRGPEHDYAWADELAAWRYVEEAFGVTGLSGGLRAGSDPRVVITTTPRPLPLIKELLKDPTTVVTRGSSYENLANLAPAFIAKVIKKYEGTRMGRQELHAEILEDVLGALWTLATIEATRIAAPLEGAPATFPRDFFTRIVVAIDPPIKSPAEAAAIQEEEDIAEAGIIVAGLGRDGHGYVLEDASRQASPLQWATIATSLYHAFKADRVIAEINQGGDMVVSTLKTADARVPVKVIQANRGKLLRAEPIAALFEQGKAHLVGTYPKLEDQMTTWVPGLKSPDRLDAMVYALTELMSGPTGEAFVL